MEKILNEAYKVLEEKNPQTDEEVKALIFDIETELRFRLTMRATEMLQDKKECLKGQNEM